MASTFSRTMRSLGGDRLHPRLILVGLALLVLWAGWARFARVPVYAATPSCRLEVSQVVHPVGSLVLGRVIAIRLSLGQVVSQNDVLVELDSALEEVRLKEAETQALIFAPKLAALREQLAREDEVVASLARRGVVVNEAAVAQYRQSDDMEKYDNAVLARKKAMRAEALASQLELMQAESDAVQRRNQSRSARIDVRKQQAELHLDASRALAHIAGLKRQLADIDGELRVAEALVTRLKGEIELYKIRAPASGRVGDIAILQVGSVVKAGDRIATIIPPGELRAIGDYEPLEAVGRIRPGQRARIRLDGFPWTQFGSLGANVLKVGDEPRDGRIRVELVVHPETMASIPLQHGMPGFVEIEVDRVSPLTLLLRSVGRTEPPPAPKRATEAGTK